MEWLLCQQVEKEIRRGNLKHCHGPKANAIEVVAILTEELGEFAQATMQGREEDARKELIQVIAVAVNFLEGTGPHFSSR